MAGHVSVLLKGCIDLLAPRPGDVVLDVTLGLGGHSEEFLKAVGETGKLVALDADLENLAKARERLSSYKNATLIHSNFRELPTCLPEDVRGFDVIVGDLGLSSPHIDDAGRGFSFRDGSPLDMRFDRTTGMSAAMLLSSLDRDKIRDIFAEYGELPRPHRLADVIVEKRSKESLTVSGDLVIVAQDIYKHDASKHLPQIFQALRIAVNDELGALKNLLVAAPALLKDGGRLGIISYHSLEDRIVKQTFKDLSTAPKDPVTGQDVRPAEFEAMTKKSIMPSEGEQKENPRSRSARLRAIRRVSGYTHPRS